MTKTASRHSGGRFDHILLVRLPILEGASGEDYTVETDGTSADGNGFPIFLIHFLQCMIQRQSAFPEITVQQSQRLPVFLLQEVIDVPPWSAISCQTVASGSSGVPRCVSRLPV